MFFKLPNCGNSITDEKIIGKINIEQYFMNTCGFMVAKLTMTTSKVTKAKVNAINLEIFDLSGAIKTKRKTKLNQ
jgi:hypothetical protein